MKAFGVKFCSFLKNRSNLQQFLVITFSVILLLMQINKNKGKVSCAHDIFYEAMADGTRKVVSKKNKKILETYELEKAILDKEGEDYNEDELYYIIFGGRKNGTMYGLGFALDLFSKSTKGNIASSRPSATMYTPGIMGELVEIQKAKQETEARLEREEEINRKFRDDSMKSQEELRLEIALLKQMCNRSCQFCNPRYPFGDGGSAFGAAFYL